MEANRDEAQQCLTVAQRAAANGDLDKAERFVRKSIHLFPTPTADAMLARIQQMRNAGPADDDEEEGEQSHHHSTNNHSSSSSHSSTHRRRTTSPPKSSAAAAAQAPSEPPKYTPEQREEARRICRIRDYYEILQVSRTANDVEMRSSFRRLALRLHPDKNHAPEAEEAFKKVNAAYECLSDQTKRLRYDQLGEDDSNASMSSRAEGARREDDLSTDQIFDMFFRMAQDSRFAGGTQHFYYQQHGHQQQQQQNYYRRRAAAAGGGGGRGRGGGGTDGDGSGRTGGAGLGLYQLAHLLPFIILILISLFNAPSAVDDMPFSLSRTNTFPQPRRTSHSQLDFFVGNSFQHRYARDPRALAHVEQLVELEWVRRWQASCEQERKDRRKWEKVAQEKHGDEQIRALERSQRPLESCERLQRFQAASSAA